MTDVQDSDFQHGRDILQSLVRGDGVIGLIADVPGTMEAMMDALWKSAGRGNPIAYRSLGDCYLANLQAMGAFDGVPPEDAAKRAFSSAASEVEDNDNEALQAALRCYFEAARLGDRASAIQFAQMSRHSDLANQFRARDILAALPNPTPAELYQLGLVQNWLHDLEDSAATHIKAAELGNLDAQFELSIYYAQGLGVEADSARAQSWLKRAADGSHPRALYNVAAAYATGSAGEQDTAKATKYYERAAEHGHGRAAATLAVMILTNEIEGTKKKSIEWLNLADEHGYASWQLLDAAGLSDPRDEDSEDEDS